MKKIFNISIFFILVFSTLNAVAVSKNVVLAYVTPSKGSLPDPSVLTHICYAFGHVSKSFDGVEINRPERLREIANLKQDAPHLKVLLSIGGWGSGRFSEMAASDSLRGSFVLACKEIVNEYNLDGIDVDWEYPGSSMSGISSSPEDVRNYTLLMNDLRNVLGCEKLITLATSATAGYYDFKSFLDCIDFVNIMSYDMSSMPGHHAALFNSDNSNGLTCEKAVDMHLKVGIPPEKLVLGLPFYGRGSDDVAPSLNYKDLGRLSAFKKKWDKKAKVPYLVDEKGEIVFNYDNPKSLKLKCKYAKKRKLLGVMYWQYNGDDDKGSLRRAVYDAMK